MPYDIRIVKKFVHIKTAGTMPAVLNYFFENLNYPMDTNSRSNIRSWPASGWLASSITVSC